MYAASQHQICNFTLADWAVVRQKSAVDDMEHGVQAARAAKRANCAWGYGAIEQSLLGHGGENVRARGRRPAPDPQPARIEAGEPVEVREAGVCHGALHQAPDAALQPTGPARHSPGGHADRHRSARWHRINRPSSALRDWFGRSPVGPGSVPLAPARHRLRHTHAAHTPVAGGQSHLGRSDAVAQL